MVLLMVQKFGGHQLRLVVCPIIYKVYKKTQVLFVKWLFGNSEPSTAWEIETSILPL